MMLSAHRYKYKYRRDLFELNHCEDELQNLFRDKGMQRHEPLRLRANSEDIDPNPLFAVLDKAHDEHEFYTASVNFLNKRLREKCRNPSSVQKATKSCCNLNTFERDVPVRESPNKYNFLLDESDEPGQSLDFNKLLPYPKPKSTKDNFLTRLSNTFRKYRRCFNAVTDTEADDSDALKSCSNFKFPRCERLNKKVDSPRLFTVSEELIQESKQEIDSAEGNSEGDYCMTTK